MRKILFGNSGQSFLALVFLIGAIVAIVGLLIAFLANSFVDTGYGFSASASAESVANSGAQDAVLRLQRGDSTFIPVSSYPCPATTYTLAVASSTAYVCVSSNSPSSGYYTVISYSTVSSRTRKVQAVLQVNASTSQVSIISWQDIQ